MEEMFFEEGMAGAFLEVAFKLPGFALIFKSDETLNIPGRISSGKQRLTGIMRL